MLTEIAAQLGIDGTFYYQFLLIVVFYFAISAAFVKPYQKLFELREAKTTGALDEAKELTAKAEEMHGQYLARMKDVNVRAQHMLKQAEEESRAEAARILGGAAEAARAKVQTTQKELEAQKGELLVGLHKESVEIAKEIVTKVLGRIA